MGNGVQCMHCRSETALIVLILAIDRYRRLQLEGRSPLDGDCPPSSHRPLWRLTRPYPGDVLDSNGRGAVDDPRQAKPLCRDGSLLTRTRRNIEVTVSHC